MHASGKQHGGQRDLLPEGALVPDRERSPDSENPERVPQAAQPALALVRAFGDVELSHRPRADCRRTAGRAPQDDSTACARTTSRGRSSAASAAARRSSSRTPGDVAPHDVDGPGDRIGRDRRPAGHGLEHHEAERVGTAREHEHVGLPVVPRELLAGLHAEEDARPGSAAAAPPRAGPSPTTHLVPGRSSARNASMFFSTATRPTYRKIGRGTSSSACGPGRKSSVSTPRDQQHEVGEAAGREAPLDVRRGHHQRAPPARGTSASSGSSRRAAAGSARARTPETACDRRS